MTRTAVAGGSADSHGGRRTWWSRTWWRPTWWRRFGSPRALALGAAIIWTVALLLVGAALRLESETQQSKRAATSLQDAAAHAHRPAGQAIAAPAPTADLAGLEAQDGDALRLLKAANDAGLALGKVEYRNEPIADLGAVVRTASLSIPGNYARVRQFLASALRDMPGCYLVELRVDRRDVRSAEAQVTLQLACVYRTDAGVAQPATGGPGWPLQAQR